MPKPSSMKTLAATLGLAAAGLTPHAAAAQVNLFARYAGPFLTPQDYDYGKDAAWKLLEGPGTVGARQSWMNPGTGNGGTLTLVSITATAPLPCRKVKSFVHYKDYDETVSYVLNVCKQPDKSWKIAE